MTTEIAHCPVVMGKSKRIPATYAVDQLHPATPSDTEPRRTRCPVFHDGGDTDTLRSLNRLNITDLEGRTASLLHLFCTNCGANQPQTSWGFGAIYVTKPLSMGV